MFDKNNFNNISIFSIRGFAYEKEDNLYNIQNEEMFNQIIRLVEKTSESKELIETCGHAMYIGSKK